MNLTDAVNAPPAIAERAMLAAFAKELEDRLFQAARDKIVPALEAEIRASARVAVRKLGVAIRSRRDMMRDSTEMLVSINGAPPEPISRD